MADLLECLLQIKGLRQTLERLSALLATRPPYQWRSAPDDQDHADDGASRPSAAELLARLAEMEGVHGVALRLILTADRPAVPAADAASLHALSGRRRWSAPEAFDRFRIRRRDNLELLDACSADDLARVGVHPVRRDISLADLVALMLASDVEHVGEIRRALGAYDAGQ